MKNTFIAILATIILMTLGAFAIIQIQQLNVGMKGGYSVLEVLGGKVIEDSKKNQYLVKPAEQGKSNSSDQPILIIKNTKDGTCYLNIVTMECESQKDITIKTK